MSDVVSESTNTLQHTQNASTSLLTPAAAQPKTQASTTESYFIHITTIKLNEENFMRWSQSVHMYIHGLDKIGYLTGESKEPAVDDATYPTWNAENSIIMTWLVNSIEEDISINYMCYHTIKELWDNINQMYSDLGNQSQVYELTLKLGEIRQSEYTVTKYFNSLKRLWQDLDLFNDYEWKSSENFKHFKKTVEDNRIFKFLIGLNVEFDEVKGMIIGRQSIPSIREVFSEVRREESRCLVMLGKRNFVNAIENSTLAASINAG